jgi:hypothetical protein
MMMLESMESVARRPVSPVAVCRSRSNRISFVSRNHKCRATGRARRTALELHLFAILTAFYSSSDEHDTLRLIDAL